MALIIRIVSPDGQTVVSKTLPALPSHLKVPPGAKVEVIDKETGQKSSLPQYINAHSSEAGEDGEGSDGSAKVTLETVQEWSEVVAWLDSLAAEETQTEMGTMPVPADTWYAPEAGKQDGEVFGFQKNTLLIGGLVGAAAVGGGVALSGGGTSDTVAPIAPAGLDLAAADDLGAESDDNITSQTSGLTISGTAEAGSRVELFDGDTSLGTTTAGDNGAFTFDVDLETGIHAVTATARDAAGNTSNLSAALNIAIDQTAPDAPTALNLLTVDDSGISNSDDLTNLTSGISISGTAEPGATVELFNGTTTLGATTAAANGTFTLDISLTEGVHSLTAVATDIAGNEGPASAAFTITVDTTAPAPVSLLDLADDDDTGASNTDNITTKTTNLTISGTAEAGASVQLFDGANSIATVTVDANGNFAFDVGLALGDHDLTATVTDAAGNASAPSPALEISVIEDMAAAAASQTFG